MESPTQQSEFYEPTIRHLHQTAVINGKLYLWAGAADGVPRVHDSPEKRAFLSKMDIFSLGTGSWENRTTSGDPPLGYVGYSCVAADEALYYFGGECGHDSNCFHNSLHRLSPSLEWTMTASSLTSEYETDKNAGPMQKSCSGMVAFKIYDKEKLLFVVGGQGLAPVLRQPGAVYADTVNGLSATNEQHLFSIVKNEWSSLNVIGQSPPPNFQFTLTQIDDREAAMFGGRNGTAVYSDLLTVKLLDDSRSVQWTKVSKSADHLAWPARRYGHAATFIQTQRALIIGGGAQNDSFIVSDCWIFEFVGKTWEKLQITSKTITQRQFHSLSAFVLSPHQFLLVVSGGIGPLSRQPFLLLWKKLDLVSSTALIDLERSSDDINAKLWKAKSVLQGQALASSRVYQAHSTSQKEIRQLNDTIMSLQKQEKELEIKNARIITEMQVSSEKEVRKVESERRTEQKKLNNAIIEEQKKVKQANITIKQLEEEIKQLKKELTLHKRRLRDLEEKNMAYQEQVIKANTDFENQRNATKKAQTEVKQLKDKYTMIERKLHQQKLATQESDIFAQEQGYNKQILKKSPTSVDQNPSSWMLNIEEVTMTDQMIGKGGWATVVKAHFRGLCVAAKRLHEKIVSDFNLQLFKREMTIAAELRHPNLVLFIGATAVTDEEPVILMELMPTNLNEELKKSKLPKKDIISISQDVAHGLMYIHQWNPHPILHRDVSSKNILLERMSFRWRAKLSDYGSTNYQNAVTTINPGSILYAAPEARDADQQSPKMDVYSFGVLLIEMCVSSPPQGLQHWRETSIKKIKWPTMVSLIEMCIQHSRENRPTMNDALKKLLEIASDESVVQKESLCKPMSTSVQTQIQNIDTQSTLPIASAQKLKIKSVAVQPSGFIRGVGVCEETEFMVVGDSLPQKLDWSDYGFNIEVPKGALPTGVTASIVIRVILKGHFELPENTKLVSALYWISCSKVFSEYVAVNIQHCAIISTEEECKKFGFIIAKCSQENLPYTFTKRVGLFNLHTQYATVKLKRFSIVGISGSMDARTSYLAMKYYRQINNKPRIEYSFVLVCNTEAHKKVYFIQLCVHDENLDKKFEGYNKDHDCHPVEFDSDEITLKLPKRPVDNWKIMALSYPMIKRSDLDGSKDSYGLCNLELQWLGARDEEVVQLHCTVKLDGAKPPRNEFVLRDMYHQQSDHRLSTHYPSMQKGLKRRLIDMGQEEVLDLQNIFLNVNNYYQLGLNLGLDDITIDMIERNHPNDTDRRKMEVFRIWKNDKPNASIEDLLKALKAARENAIAEKIKLKYCGEPHTHPTYTVAPINQPRLPRNARQHSIFILPTCMLALLAVVLVVVLIIVMYNYYR